MGAGSSSFAPTAVPLAVPPDGATLRASLDALTAAPPPTSSTDAKIAAAAITRQLGRLADGARLQAKSKAPSAKAGAASRTRSKRAPLPTPATPAMLADAMVEPPPSLSNVGVSDLDRMLGPPPAALYIEVRSGLLLPYETSNASWGDALGLYKLVDGLAIRHKPVWRHASGRDRWLAYSPHGWMVQSEKSLERLQYGTAEWAKKLSLAAVECFLLLEDDFGRPPDLPPPGSVWQGWDGEKWVPLDALTCVAADAAGRRKTHKCRPRTKKGGGAGGDVEGFLDGGAGGVSGGGRRRGGRAGDVGDFLSGGGGGPRGARPLASCAGRRGRGAAGGGSAAGYLVGLTPPAAYAPLSGDAAARTPKADGDGGAVDSDLISFLAGGHAGAERGAADVTDFLTGGVGVGRDPKGAKAHETPQALLDSALDDIFGAAESGGKHKHTRVPRRMGRADDGATARGARGKKPLPPPRPGMPGRMVLDTDGCRRVWRALGTREALRPTNGGLARLYDAPAAHRKRNEAQLEELRRAVQPRTFQRGATNHLDAAKAEVASAAASQQQHAGEDAAASTPAGGARRLTRAEMAASIARMHDARVEARKKRFAALASATPSLPVAGSAAATAGGGGGGGGGREGLIGAEGFVVVTTRRPFRPSDKDVRGAFARIDARRTGYIDASQLRNALLEVGLSTTDLNRADAVLSRYDAADGGEGGEAGGGGGEGGGRRVDERALKASSRRSMPSLRTTISSTPGGAARASSKGGARGRGGRRGRGGGPAAPPPAAPPAHRPSSAPVGSIKGGAGGVGGGGRALVGADAKRGSKANTGSKGEPRRRRRAVAASADDYAGDDFEVDDGPSGAGQADGGLHAESEADFEASLQPGGGRKSADDGGPASWAAAASAGARRGVPVAAGADGAPEGGMPKITMPLEEYSAMIERLHRPSRTGKAEQKAEDLRKEEEIERLAEKRRREKLYEVIKRSGGAAGTRTKPWERSRPASAAAKDRRHRLESAGQSSAMYFGKVDDPSDPCKHCLVKRHGIRVRSPPPHDDTPPPPEEDVPPRVPDWKPPPRPVPPRPVPPKPVPPRPVPPPKPVPPNVLPPDNGGGGGGGSADDIVAVCPNCACPGDELVVALPDGDGLVLTTVPHGVAPGDEFLVKVARRGGGGLGGLAGAGAGGKSSHASLVKLVERLLGGRGGRGEKQRRAFEEQVAELIAILRDAEGDRTKAIAVEHLLLELFGEEGAVEKWDDDLTSEEEYDDASEAEAEGGGTAEAEGEEEGEEEQESEAEESSEGEYEGDDATYAIEVICPAGCRAGDEIEVRVPPSAGGGRVMARVPEGATAGDVFEVHLD